MLDTSGKTTDTILTAKNMLKEHISKAFRESDNTLIAGRHFIAKCFFNVRVLSYEKKLERKIEKQDTRHSNMNQSVNGFQ